MGRVARDRLQRGSNRFRMAGPSHAVSSATIYRGQDGILRARRRDDDHGRDVGSRAGFKGRGINGR